MTSHELAKELLKNPDQPLHASIDTSVDDATAGDRCFSEDLSGWQQEPIGVITLLFVDGENN